MSEEQQQSIEETKENKKDAAKRLGRNIVQMKYNNNEKMSVMLKRNEKYKSTTYSLRTYVSHQLFGTTIHIGIQ